jgi:hypothetical protein
LLAAVFPFMYITQYSGPNEMKAVVGIVSGIFDDGF